MERKGEKERERDRGRESWRKGEMEDVRKGLMEGDRERKANTLLLYS